MFDERNIPAIIQRRLSEDEIRQEEREKCAKFIEELKQYRLPEILRNCGFGDDEEGWVDLWRERTLVKGIAAAIRKGQHDEK